jgi:hypothetical protein
MDFTKHNGWLASKENEMETVKELLDEIVRLPEPISAYSVTVGRSDFSGGYQAHAVLRGGEIREYSAKAETPEEALNDLILVLKSLICPYCGQFAPKDEKED